MQKKLLPAIWACIEYCQNKYPSLLLHIAQLMHTTAHCKLLYTAHYRTLLHTIALLLTMPSQSGGCMSVLPGERQ